MGSRRMEIQDRYEIKRKLGQGGVGAVYEGYDTQLKRKVAIKRLMTGDDDEKDEDNVAELLRECHSLSALSSPNIVSVFDFGQDSDGPFVVMELLDGETLEEVIQRAPFTEADFLLVAEQSMEGILAAHHANFLHRDLKPCNFMLTWLPSGRKQVKLLDFGLAKFTTEPMKQTIAHGNSLFGSIYFMAPEQFEQEPLDGRTDLYSLGAVFYYSLAGVYPFDGDSVAQVMAGHLTGNYKDLREYRPDIHPGLAKWVMGLIARHPDHRPSSCAEALAQFQGVLQGTYDPPEPTSLSAEVVQEPLSQHASIGAQTATVRLEMPGSNPTLDGFGPSAGASTASASVALPTGEKEGLPKAVYYIAAGIVGLVAALLLFKGTSEDASAQEEDQTTVAAPTLPPELTGQELMRTLRLPYSPINLISRRDLNYDSYLTIDEFSVAPTSKSKKTLRDYFPRLDKDGDGLLSPHEINWIYKSRG